MRISVRIIISSLLAAVVIFGCSVLVFASEETQEPIPEGVLLADQDDAALVKLSSDIKSATASSYSIDDIYNLLNSALKGSSTSSTYSLPYIANRINLINNKVGTIDTNLSTSVSLLSGLCNGLYGSTANNPAFNVMDSLYHYNDLDGNTYGVAELLAMSWGHLDDISDNLITYLPIFQTALHGIDTSVDAVNSSVVSGFNQLHSDLTSVPWVSGGSFVGVCYDLSNISYLDLSSSGVYSSKPYFVFNLNYAQNENAIYHVLIPLYYSRLDDQINQIQFDFGILYNGAYNQLHDVSSLVMYSRYSCDVYFTLPRNFNLNSQLIISSDNYKPYYSHHPSTSPFVYYISSSYSGFFDLYDTIRFASLNSQIERLTNAIAPDNVVAAEEASQGVIDQALDDFTGSGSGAAKISDSAAMSSVSGSVQSGLDTGASVSNATSVFSLSSDFWGWFTQSNSNYINNPYPAPTFTPTRSPGDQIVDFLSTNSELVQDLLGGDQR